MREPQLVSPIGMPLDNSLINDQCGRAQATEGQTTSGQVVLGLTDSKLSKLNEEANKNSSMASASGFLPCVLALISLSDYLLPD